MEKDFKLCENEGLFQEYLEMGKYKLLIEHSTYIKPGFAGYITLIKRI